MCIRDRPNTESIRTSQWKLIYNEYDDSKELYNLKDDPSEENNLIEEEISIKEELWNSLKDILGDRTTDDENTPLSKRGLVSP